MSSKLFVGTAAQDSRVNLSPKGMDTLRVLDDRRVAWLNVTGSGNETAAHVEIDPRMTIMFCAFEGPPLILRLYGRARAIHLKDPEWEQLYALFAPLPGARQIFELAVDLVQTSCGAGVPLYQYQGNREALNEWSRKKGEEGTAAVSFKLDRSGKVISAQLDKSSGSDLLDKEALEVLNRASPFPQPPSDVPDVSISLSLPIQFRIKR